MQEQYGAVAISANSRASRLLGSNPSSAAV